MNGLAQALECPAYTEGEDINPFMERYYADAARWAVHNAMFFLNRAWDSQIAIRSSQGIGLQDRTAWDQFYVFMNYRLDKGLFSKEEYALFGQLMRQHSLTQGLPDLFLYLRTTPSEAHERLTQRARGYEAGVELEFLEDLHTRYERWIQEPEIAERVIILEDLDFRDEKEIDVLATRIRALL